MSAASVYSEAWLPGPSKTQFYTRTYVPEDAQPKAVVVFVHGFAEHIGRYTHFHPLFAQRGIAVFAFDQRGFGLTAQDEKKSKSSAYGKTCWKDQMADIAWAIEHVEEAFKGIPILLMGHSMGGAEVLGFVTQGTKSPHTSAASSILAVIATSPLIRQTEPTSKILKWLGSKASLLAPYTLIATPLKADELSHDKQANDRYVQDKLIRPFGSLRGVSDMLSHGEILLTSSHANWPNSLPLLLVHGTADKITSFKASEEFMGKISANTKKIVSYENGFHELHNEPDGVKERLAEDIIQFIESQLPPTISVTEADPSSTISSINEPSSTVPASKL